MLDYHFIFPETGKRIDYISMVTRARAGVAAPTCCVGNKACVRDGDNCKVESFTIDTDVDADVFGDIAVPSGVCILFWVFVLLLAVALLSGVGDDTRKEFVLACDVNDAVVSKLVLLLNPF